MENNNTALELERNELNLLVKQGIKFGIPSKVHRRKKGIRGFFQKREEANVTENFEIHEPTLSVLDRLSSIWVEMVFNEEGLATSGTESIAVAKRIAKDNTARMARIIAIAVLGEEYHVTTVGWTGRIRKYDDNKELDRLTDIFFHTIKPSKLVGLSEAITSISNLGDFIGSMHLMSGARTTQPIKERIE